MTGNAQRSHDHIRCAQHGRLTLSVSWTLYGRQWGRSGYCSNMSCASNKEGWFWPAYKVGLCKRCGACHCSRSLTGLQRTGVV